MQLVFLHVVMALVGAGALAAVLGLGALALAPVAWPVAVLGLTLVAGAALSIEGMTGVRITPVVGVGLVVLAGAGLRRWRAGDARRAKGAGHDGGGVAEIVAWFVLAFLLVHAATPLFRVDQWTYHLVVAKHVALGGALKTPILNDHIIFAGVYEYLMLLPRLFTMNDVVIHGLADALTWILFTVTTTTLLRLLAEALGWKAPAWPLIAVFVLATVPTYDMVTNAKPDVLTIPCVLALALALVKREWVVFGFVAVAPMALKPTWAHAGVAAVAALAVVLADRRPDRRVLPAQVLLRVTAGGVLGALVVLPVWIENVRFFGNALHPAQIGPLHSTFWSDAMAAHWALSTGKGPYFTTLLDLLPLLVVAIASRNVVFAAPFVTYVLVWPLLFGSAVYARFVYPLTAFLLIIALWAFHKAPRYHWLLLLPVVINGSLEVKGLQLAKALPLTVDQLYASFPSPMQERNFYELINAHRRAHFPEASLRAARILSDNNSAYHFDGQIIRYTSYEYPLLAGTPLDVRYLFSWKVPFDQWPAGLQPLIAAGAPLDPEGRVLYLPR